jgi:hypothetical protein
VIAKSKQYASPLALSNFGGTRKQMERETANRIREREPPTIAQQIYPHLPSTTRDAQRQSKEKRK